MSPLRSAIENRVPDDAIYMYVILQISQFFDILPDIIGRLSKKEGRVVSEREAVEKLMKNKESATVMEANFSFAFPYIKQEINGAPVHNGRN